MTASELPFPPSMRPSRESLRFRCWAAAEPAPDCSSRSNASRTHQDSLQPVAVKALSPSLLVRRRVAAECKGHSALA